MTCHTCNGAGTVTTYICDNPDFPTLRAEVAICHTCHGKA